MKFVIGWILALFAVVGGSSDSREPEIEFEAHFKALSTKRNPNYEDGKPWLLGRKYILDRMRHYGIRDLQEQVFNTTVGGNHVEGVNLVGVAEGRAGGDGPVIVVGADYDTTIIGNQLKDNTGGIACMLETMHILFDEVYWNQYFQNFTIIFVAFDLNTREYKNTDMGRPGSSFFVKEWLIPYLNNETVNRDFRGAIILDSVTTFNRYNETQLLRNGFEEAMPSAYEDIKERGSKGDFLGFLYLSKDEENPIKSTFMREYNKDKSMRPYRLQDMALHLNFDIVGDDVMDMINHQSHYYFWTYMEGYHLPAFLLFDTDEDRIDSNPDACDELRCSAEEFLTKDRIAFMKKTTTTLVSTLRHLQATYFEEFPDTGAASIPPAAILVPLISFLIAQLWK